MVAQCPPGWSWQKIWLDLFHFGSKDVLITVDYYSDFFEIYKLEKMNNNRWLWYSEEITPDMLYQRWLYTATHLNFHQPDLQISLFNGISRQRKRRGKATIENIGRLLVNMYTGTLKYSIIENRYKPDATLILSTQKNPNSWFRKAVENYLQSLWGYLTTIAAENC